MAHNSRIQSSIAGKSQQEEFKTAYHIASIVRKQSCSLSPFIHSNSLSQGWYRPHPVEVLPPPLNLSGKTLLDSPRTSPLVSLNPVVKGDEPSQELAQDLSYRPKSIKKWIPRPSPKQPDSVHTSFFMTACQSRLDAAFQTVSVIHPFQYWCSSDMPLGSLGPGSPRLY